jgi:hypothetical protein
MASLPLTLKNGREVEIPMVDGKTIWKGQPYCPRCGGEPDADGKLTGGQLQIRRVTASGIWYGFVAACDCVYGAWRHEIQHLGYADDLLDIPRGLSNSDWRYLAAVGKSMSYQEAADKLDSMDMPEGVRERIRRAVAAVEGNYNPDGPRREGGEG